jgi:hypothetical protein
MALQGISTGTTPNDGTGDSLILGATKVNSNFQEIYDALGNGTNLLTGNPNLTVGVVTATSFVGPLTGEVDSPQFDTNSSGVVVTGVCTATSGFGSATAASPVTLNVVGSNLIIEVPGVGSTTLPLT